MACAPLVGPEFAGPRARRAEVRARWGLQPEETAVLVSSGSWGIGRVRATFQTVAAKPGLVPIVACGHNHELRRQLEQLAGERRWRAVVLGWTDDMAGVMAASDVLVDNAGGLTCFEAMQAGLPMVTFHPIPGHGRKSAADMAAAGVSWRARDETALVGALRQLGRPSLARDHQLRATLQLLTGDAATAVEQVGVFGPPPVPRPRSVVRLARAASSAALAGATAWVGLTTGVAVAAAAGAGVAHPPPGHSSTVYVGARLSEQELAAPQVREVLRETHASAVVSVATAERDPGAVRALSALGVDLESGGVGYQPGAFGAPTAPWTLARGDSRSVQVLSVIAGQPVTHLVPNRSLSAFDLVDARFDHVTMVVPDTTLPMAPSGPSPQDDLALPVLQGGQIYVVNGPAVSSDQLVVLLSELEAQLAGQHLAIAPLSGLQ